MMVIIDNDLMIFNKTAFQKFNIKIIGAVVPGAGAFEIFAWQELQKFKDEIKGKSRLGIQAFAEALLIIPKTICKLLCSFYFYS